MSIRARRTVKKTNVCHINNRAYFHLPKTTLLIHPTTVRQEAHNKTTATDSCSRYLSRYTAGVTSLGQRGRCKFKTHTPAPGSCRARRGCSNPARSQGCSAAALSGECPSSAERSPRPLCGHVLESQSSWLFVLLFVVAIYHCCGGGKVE